MCRLAPAQLMDHFGLEPKEQRGFIKVGFSQQGQMDIIMGRHHRVCDHGVKPFGLCKERERNIGEKGLVPNNQKDRKMNRRPVKEYSP